MFGILNSFLSESNILSEAENANAEKKKKGEEKKVGVFYGWNS